MYACETWTIDAVIVVVVGGSGSVITIITIIIIIIYNISYNPACYKSCISAPVADVCRTQAVVRYIQVGTHHVPEITL